MQGQSGLEKEGLGPGTLKIAGLEWHADSTACGPRKATNTKPAPARPVSPVTAADNLKPRATTEMKLEMMSCRAGVGRGEGEGGEVN